MTRIWGIKIRSRTFVILQAIFVTVLWSSSWVIIKKGLKEIPPLYFASLRYLLASIVLMGLILSDHKKRNEMLNINRNNIKDLIVYGFVFITLTQGLQFVALDILPAITISFILNFTIFVVVILSTLILDEIPNRNQIIIIIVAVFSGVGYFYPLDSVNISLYGGIILMGVLMANSSSQIIGRQLNRTHTISPFVLTGTSMFFGSIILFIVAIFIENFQTLSFSSILIISWLAVVNTALAFTLWNDALRQLKAFEISIINNTMLPQITFLAIIFLDENPSLNQWISIIIIIIAAFLVLSLTTDKTSQKDKIE